MVFLMAVHRDRIQNLMDEVYNKWQENDNRKKGKWDILNGFSEAHQIAMMFGNFNNQVENGGIEQWISNQYFHEDAEKLTRYLETAARSDERCKKILDIVYQIDKYAPQKSGATSRRQSVPSQKQKLNRSYDCSRMPPPRGAALLFLRKEWSF